MSLSKMVQIASLGMAVASFHPAKAQTVDEFWRENSAAAVGATSGFQFYKKVVAQWMTANRIRQQDASLANDMESYFLKPVSGKGLSEGYDQFIGTVAEVENPNSRHANYRQFDVEKYIDGLIKGNFKERLAKLEIPAPYISSADKP